MFDHVWGKVFRDIDITQGLSTFDRPVFLGRYDFLVTPPSSWDRIRPKFRNLTVRSWNGRPSPPSREPELFDAELLRWIAIHP